MQIAPNTLNKAFNNLQAQFAKKDEQTGFGDVFNALILDKNHQKNIQSSGDANPLYDPASFLANLSKLGAGSLLAMINDEKIKTKIDEKRAELEKSLNVDELSGKEKIAALASIEETLSEYKKQLLEEIKAASEAQKELEASKKEPLNALLA